MISHLLVNIVNLCDIKINNIFNYKIKTILRNFVIAKALQKPFFSIRALTSAIRNPIIILHYAGSFI